MAETTTMSTYVVECTCGHDMKVNAADREDAIKKMKGMMDERGIKEHFQKYHRDEEMPSLSDVHAQIERDIKEM